MGKCSGLKGGGHHRRALDVAEKKKSEKAARKQEQAANGKRAVILKDILTSLDADCDLYLDAAICDAQGSANNTASTLPELCRTHFRHEACHNKRCRFSKEHSIAEALSNVVSGTNTADSDGGPLTIPALRHLPGILNSDTHKKKKPHPLLRRRRDRTANDNDTTSRPLSRFESALSEGSSAVERIVACLESDQDVVNFGLTCWHLCHQILLNGGGCPDVQLRKYRAKHRKLERRNAKLLSNKALAGSLRYAVGYFESTSSNSSKKKKNKKTSNSQQQQQQPSLRPVLIFDYENPNVYKAFSESGVRKTYDNHNIHQLGSSLAKDCTVTE